MNLLLSIVALPIVGSALVALLPNDRGRAAAWTAGLAALAAAGLLAAAAPAVFGGAVLHSAWSWLPGIDFGFRLDGLAFLFAVLVLSIGVLVILYARYYLGPEEPIARFYAYLLAFMGAMLGLVLADNLILMVVFWELTSLASFMLIGFWRHEAAARQGARMALAVTGAGGLALLAGALLLGHMAGGYELERVLAAGDAVRGHPWYDAALVLVLAGAFTKSAQFPFHFWLPQAMAAPTPVSAYLHSATMVKAGVFLLARLYPALAGTEQWFFIVSGAGLATLLLGAYVAVFQHDLKGLLAYSTISHLGLVTLLLGLNSPFAAVAAVFHILNHATFKASLFMAAGIIDHECGTRDMRRINGLWRYMPQTATLAIVAASAMAGVPLLNGFLSKEMFFAETLFIEGHLAIEIAAPLAATLAGMFSVAYSMRFVHDVFFNGAPRGLDRLPHEPPPWMKVPVGVLALACLGIGIVPALTVAPLLALGARAVLGGTLPEYSLAIWHGFNLPLLMSFAAFAGGAAFYFSLQRLYRLHEHVQLRRGGKDLFDAAMAGLLAAARRITGGMENGSLQRYLLLLVLAVLLMTAWPLLRDGVAAGSRAATPADAAAWVVWGVVVVAALGAALAWRQRVVALTLLGAVGLAVSIGFVYLSAPDLALTQLLVEVVTILLMMLALYYLPQHSPRERSPLRLARDLALAAAAGAGVAALAYAMLMRPQDTLSGYYVEQALPAGGGTNVVNVIIVDFRALDTLGEIAVLAVAGLVIHALLRGFQAGGDAALPPPVPDRYPLLLAAVGRLLLPLATVLAIHLFLRGHNLPGGGFAAGLVLAVALIIQYVAAGADWVERRYPLDHVRWIAAGLLAAGLTGVASMGLGYPFLTSSFAHPNLPLVGEVPIASAMFFDLGVFLTVVGATLLALSSLGRVHGRAAQGEA